MGLLGKNEDARVEKPDGTVVGPYQAMFAGSTILILDPKADVEEGDTILRQLPNGKDERSIVTQATFFSQGVGPIGAHYQLKFRKGGLTDSRPPRNRSTSPVPSPYKSATITRKTSFARSSA